MRNFRHRSLVIVIAVILSAVTAMAQQDPSTTEGVISGQVITETGQPVPNAVVFLRGSAPLFQPRTATTDSEGRFRITGLDPLLYGVTASAPAYIVPPRDSDSPPMYYRVGDTVTINMIKGGVIAGTVLNSGGDPVVQIAVRAIMIRDARGEVPRIASFQQQKTTDDRGMYRLYGLAPGTYVVSTVNRGSEEVMNAYDGEAPTYSPSSTRETAAEITVRADEEVTADIRYRSEAGRIISGKVVGPVDPQSQFIINVNLNQTIGGASMYATSAFQRPGTEGFAFYGVADGEYDVTAHYVTGQTDALMSEPRHVKVKGADISGLEIVLKPLGSIDGHMSLVKSDLQECKDKREPSFAETLVMARMVEKNRPKDQPRPTTFFFAQGAPNSAGDFRLRNLSPGQYNLHTRFYARYWYLQSMTLGTPAVATKTATNRPDIARDGITLKSGERVRDLTITLAEGAGSLRGKIMRDEGIPLPQNLYIHLVPAEKENAENPLRYFVTPVQPDGTYVLNNLAPGSYWVLGRTAVPNESLESKTADTLVQLRRMAEARKDVIEFKPCQSITGYLLPIR